MEEISNYHVQKKRRNMTLLVPDFALVLPVLGNHVERVYVCRDKYFLCLSANSRPFEESLYLCLYSFEGEVIDKVKIFKAYEPSILKYVEIEEGNGISFQFIRGLRHSVSVKDNAKFDLSRLIRRREIFYSQRFKPSQLRVSRCTKKQINIDTRMNQ
uniref:hypothetical protein n=1 Tax=Thaumasiovibrio subtropicus TaxID=1891207 RepID=UPI000B34D483|nr:hypothetical protein [Thaumasiovibrio subtropicus]